MVDVCLLGCGGMMPLPHRRLSAMLYRYDGSMILIDCGEGTQVSVKQTGWGFKSIDVVCFTHCHADHIAGLPGFLLTLGNAERTEPLLLIGPPGLTQAVYGLTVIASNLPFELRIIELPATEASKLQLGNVTLSCLPARHSVPCFAYRLDITRPGLFDVIRAQEQNIPLAYWKRLQQGETIDTDDRFFSPDMVLGPHRKGISVTYCTDTRPFEALIPFCAQSDLLVCEGLYGDDEKLQSAIDKMHMTFSEAAWLALGSSVNELWLTHYSPSLNDPEEFMPQTRKVFSNSHAGFDLKKRMLKYSD